MWRAWKEEGEGNLIVWWLHMVPWLFASPWLPASRLRGLSLFQTYDKLPYPPFIHLSISNPPSIHTLNLVRGNNRRGKQWVGIKGVLEKKVGGVSSDPQKTLSNKTGTLRGWQWSGLLFSVLCHWWGKIREFLNTAKEEERGAALLRDPDLKSKHTTQPPIDYSLCVFKGGWNKAALCWTS